MRSWTMVLTLLRLPLQVAFVRVFVSALVSALVCAMAIMLTACQLTPSLTLPMPAVANVEPEDLSSMAKPAVLSDVPGMLAAMQKINKARLSPKRAASYDCIQQRFAANSVDALEPNLHPTVSQVLAAFKHYWRDVSQSRRSRAEADQALKDKLVAVLLANGIKVDGLSEDEIGAALRALLERTGVHVLLGVTHPNYELMIWRKEESKRYEVVLPESKQNVEVVFISDFIAAGWLSFLTCDAMGTGGWTTKEKIYVKGSIAETDANSLQFQTNLHHEGQHFADFVAYPKLQQPELEYRAKLTQLATSTTDTKEALEEFFNNASVGRSAPHAHAEHWLKINFINALPLLTDANQRKSVDDESIRNTARRLLLESTATIKATGAATTARFLPDRYRLNTYAAVIGT
jgi:hypothetical protein